MFRKLMLGTIGILSVLVPGFSEAAWVDIGKAPDGVMVQGESDRFSRKGDAVSAVGRLAYPEPRMMPFSSVKYDATEITYHFQCAEKKLIVAETILREGQTVVYSTKSSDANPLVARAQAQSVPAEGVDAMVFAWACAKK